MQGRSAEKGALLADLDPHRSRTGGATAPPGSLRLQQLYDQYDLVVALLDTGCRYSEVTALTWDCIDTIEWSTFNVYRTKVGKDGVLAMTSRLRDVLKRRWEARRNTLYIFPARDDPDSPRGHATDGIMRAMERAGINAPHKVKRYGKATVHTLRDTFASRLAELGYPLHKIQKLLGHSTPVMTQKYAKFSEAVAAAEAASVLDSLSTRREEADGPPQ